MSETPEITGVTLAGGRSERMGRDKAAIEIGGRTLLQRTADTLCRAFGEVVVVLRPDQPEPPLETPPGCSIHFTRDICPGRGPLAGIHAAMLAAERELYFAAACDMPFLNKTLLRRMAGIAGENRADVVIPRHADGRFHPLHAVYRRTCLPHITRVLEEARTNRIIGFFDSVNVYWMEEPEIRALDPELLSLVNINTEEDLKNAERILSEIR